MGEIVTDAKKARAVQAAVDALVQRRRPYGMSDTEFYMEQVRRGAERDAQTVLKAFFEAMADNQVGASQDEGGQG